MHMQAGYRVGGVPYLPASVKSWEPPPAVKLEQLRGAVRIQAWWRGVLYRRRMPLWLGRLYTEHLIRTVRAGLPPRKAAKSFIRARNRRIRILRAEIERTANVTNLLFRNPLSDELEAHMFNPKHRLRAALICQAWWRGCRCRGWKGRLGGPHRRRSSVQASSLFAADDDFLIDWQGLDVWPKGMEWPSVGALASALPSIPGISSITGAIWADQTDTYRGTRIQRMPIPARRTLHDPRRVQIFYSDTGGGHRASALALEAALRRQYGDQVQVCLTDFIREAASWPWSLAPEGYQVVGNYPSIYKKIYEAGRDFVSWRETRCFQLMWYFNRESILEFLSAWLSDGVDLIISVHPLVNHLVMEAFEEIFCGRANATVPFVTVVTDLGSAHISWFDPRVDLLFVPSEDMQKLAMHYKVPRGSVLPCGLPVREGFWEPGAAPKATLRKQLGLPASEKAEVVLLMGGGEGFGNLFRVATCIGDKLGRVGFGQLVVICGRNEELRSELESYEWPEHAQRRRGQAPLPVILGFVSDVDRYMSAADCLVTKAGPGSIAEAMIKGLPCLLTSFVPGQEEGNITFVTSGGAGQYVPDTEPEDVADTVADWLADPEWLAGMSRCAQKLARPRAALDITRRICDSLLELGVELREGPPARPPRRSLSPESASGSGPPSSP